MTARIKIFRAIPDINDDLVNTHVEVGLANSLILDREDNPGHSFCNAYQFGSNRHQTDNPTPYENLARQPDTGFAGLNYTFTVTFDANEDLPKILRWSVEDNALRGIAPEGRFGIINESDEWTSTKPVSDGGFKFVNFQVGRTFGSEGVLLKGTMVFLWSGDPRRIGNYQPTLIGRTTVARTGDLE